MRRDEMTYFQEEASIRYITHDDDNTSDDLGKLSGNAGTVSASFHASGSVSVTIWSTDAKALNLTLDQARHLVSVLTEFEKIHASNQKVK